MQMLEPGVSLLALRARVPLVPVLLKGTFHPFRRVDLYVGDAIAYDDLLDSGMDRDTRDKLTVRIAEAVLALGK